MLETKLRRENNITLTRHQLVLLATIDLNLHCLIDFTFSMRETYCRSVAKLARDLWRIVKEDVMMI